MLQLHDPWAFVGSVGTSPQKFERLLCVSVHDLEGDIDFGCLLGRDTWTLVVSAAGVAMAAGTADMVLGGVEEVLGTRLNLIALREIWERQERSLGPHVPVFDHMALIPEEDHDPEPTKKGNPPKTLLHHPDTPEVQARHCESMHQNRSPLGPQSWESSLMRMAESRT